MKKGLKGFTMVELLVAMAIIGLLIATAIWGIGVAQQSARNTQRREAGAQILAGFSEYYSRFNKQPANAGFTTTGLCLMGSSSGTSNTCTCSSCYEVKLNGIVLPSGNSSGDISAGTVSFGSTTASNTGWLISSNGGSKICAALEGGGWANLSEPQSMVCDTAGHGFIGTAIPIDDGKILPTM